MREGPQAMTPISLVTLLLEGEVVITLTWELVI